MGFERRGEAGQYLEQVRQDGHDFGAACLPLSPFAAGGNGIQCADYQSADAPGGLRCLLTDGPITVVLITMVVLIIMVILIMMILILMTT